MASTFAFLTDTASRSSLFRHWALVIVLSSLLSTINVGFLHVQAEPNMLISAISNDQLPPSASPNPSSNDSIAIIPIFDFQLGGSPLVNIPLSNVPNIAEIKALLTISSGNDSTSANFLLDISNPSLQRRGLAESIIYGFLGVSITNLCAVTGFICIPIKRSKYFNILLGFMTALAVGALFSTAILVLIPEAMRMIDMPAEFGGQGRSYLLKLGCVLAGALFFFVVEYFLMILPRLLKWNVSPAGDKSFEGTDIADTSNWHESSHGSRPDPANDDVSSLEKDVVLENGESTFNDNVYISQKASTTRRSRRCCLDFKKENFSKIAPVAWMILFGDGFHNFMDGLTIGAGFTQSPTIGIALSLSILFEELPHELGDFAVLIASGFSIKSAICANFTSACSAYLGLIIGLIIGEVSAGALYVFAITAGFFFYISLSDMLPSLRNALEEAEKNNANSFRLFLVQVAGLIVGFLCVLGVTLLSDLISL